MFKNNELQISSRACREICGNYRGLPISVNKSTVGRHFRPRPEPLADGHLGGVMRGNPQPAGLRDSAPRGCPPAVAVHRVNQNFHVFGRGELGDAVPQIEDMAAGLSGFRGVGGIAVEYAAGLGGDLFG